MYQRFNAEDFTKRYGLNTIGIWEDVVKLIQPQSGGPWIVGGAVRRLIHGDNLDSDFDIAFASQDQFLNFKQDLEDVDCREIAKTEHHTTLSATISGKKVPIQLLKVSYAPKPEDILETFDFTICQFAFDGTDFICGPYSLYDLARKRLAVNKVTFAASTVRRTIKYTKQGYTMCQGAIVTILESVAANPELINADIKYLD